QLLGGGQLGAAHAVDDAAQAAAPLVVGGRGRDPGGHGGTPRGCRGWAGATAVGGAAAVGRAPTVVGAGSRGGGGRAGRWVRRPVRQRGSAGSGARPGASRRGRR